MLIDSGMINGRVKSGGRLSCIGMTQKGHDLVDAIRDPQIWRKTKEATDKVGSWTVGLLLDCATAYAKAQLKCKSQDSI
jgi:hypothetical protein